ncbi:hypothetical protein MMC07_009726 [Pseudocyphellaria aurata]|nr:hypothetical protein [Pseudocyphellaria aurata]
MGNQVESFEDDRADPGIGEHANEDAKKEANGHPNGHTNGDAVGDANGVETSHGAEENFKVNTNLVALLPDGSKYEDDEDDDKDDPGLAPGSDPSPGPLNAPTPGGDAGVGLGQTAKKKKSKSKSKSKRGLAAPTGFEEFYVDTPLTPAEHKEERQLYDGSIAFAERIQTAIQRYFAKRNLNSERKDLFDKYMAYGGIDAGPKMFSGGLDAKTRSNKNAAEIATISATHYVPLGRGESDDPSHVVDFEACAQGFLTSRMPSVFDLLSPTRIKSYVAIIRNFLNYLLHHDVCPEYDEQIQAARRVCDHAERELLQIAEVNRQLPGDFNRACSEIFGGIYQGLYLGDQEWAEGVDGSGEMSPETARKTFRVGLTAQASEEVFQKYTAQGADKSIGVTSVFDAGLEVTELIPPDQEVLALYNAAAGKDLQPVGKLRAKSWHNPLSDPEDLTVEEEAAATAGETGPTEQYEFWVEEELLRHCFVGMKIETKVHRTSFGLDYFDAVTGVYCSFFRVLPNELIIGWREPGPRLPMREKPGGGEGGGGEGDEGGEGGEKVGEGNEGEGGEGNEDDGGGEGKDKGDGEGKDKDVGKGNGEDKGEDKETSNGESKGVIQEE